MKQALGLLEETTFSKRRRRSTARALLFAPFLLVFLVLGPSVWAQFGCGTPPDQDDCNTGAENTIFDVGFSALVPANSNNVSSGCNTASFSDFSASPIGTVVAGNVFTVNVTFFTNGALDDQSIGVWLDYDNDGTADDFQSQFIANSSGGFATFNFTTPPGAATATAAMLVRLIDNVGALAVTDACTDFTAAGVGETEAYSFVILSAPTNFAGPTTVCQGSALNLVVANTVNGVAYNVTGPNGYSFDFVGDGLTHILTVTANAGAVEEGIYTLSENGAPTLAVLVDVVINKGAGALAVSGSLCENTGTLVLSALPFVDIGGAGSDYLFTAPDGTSFTQDAPTFSKTPALTDNGVWTVTIADTANCFIYTASANVTVNATPATPTPNSNSPVCEGQTIMLFGPTLTGATYDWSGPGFTSSVQNPIITNATNAANTGVYGLTVTQNGCVSTQGTVTVTVNPLPATPSGTSDGPICGVANLTLTASSTVAGQTYEWQGPNGLVLDFAGTGADVPFVLTNATTANAGFYTLTTTDANGCTSLPFTLQVETFDLGVPTFSVSNNNPCTDFVQNVSNTVVTYNGPTLPSTASYTWNCDGCDQGVLPNSPGPHTISWNLLGQLAGVKNVSLTVQVGSCVSAVGVQGINVVLPPSVSASSNSPVCEGESILLFASDYPGAFYSWFTFAPPFGPNIPFSSASQNPIIYNSTVNNAGDYIVQAFDAVSNCVSDLSFTSIVVNSKPATPVISSNSPVCLAGQIDLTVTGTILGATYQITGPNAFSDIFVGTGGNITRSITNITAANIGSYTVNVVDNNCASDPATTLVDLAPKPSMTIVSDSPICQGANLTITVTANITVPYTIDSYAPDGTFFGTVPIAAQIYSVTGPLPAGPGVYTYQVRNSAGCLSDFVALTVVENPVPTAVASNGGAACIGGTIQLFAQTVTGATYAWLGPNGFTSSNQNPTRANATAADAGDYSLTVTLNGCVSTQVTTTVTLNALPVPTPTSNSPLCADQTLTLVEGAGGFAQWAWTGPNGFTSGNQNPMIANVTTIHSGTYTVNVVDANGCASLPVSTEVIVNANPVITFSNNGPVCDGTNVLFLIEPLINATYFYINPLGFLAGGPSASNGFTTPVADGVDEGIWTAFAIDANGCQSNIANTILVINPTPVAVASNGGAACIGGTLQLFAQTVTGATYAWTGPNGFASSNQNPTRTNVTAADAGDYSLTVTLNGCVSLQVTTTVTINALPVPTPTNTGPYCVGATVMLMETTGGFSQWMWTGPNGFSSVNQNPTIANSTTVNGGTYTVSVIDANGCTSLPVSTEVIVNPVPSVSLTSNAPVCAGATLSLTATAVSGATYTFTDPTGGVTGPQASNFLSVTAVVATHNGTWTVSVTSATCGAQTATAFVQVNAAPIAPTVSSTTPLCEGNTLTLTASTTVVGATYMWAGPNGYSQNFIGTGADVLFNLTSVTVANSGDYSLTITQSGCTNFSTTNVLVNPKPAAPTVQSNSPVCELNTINGLLITATPDLSATGTYTATPPLGLPTPFNAFNVHQVIPANAVSDDGIWTVVYTDNTTLCSSDAVTVNVIVKIDATLSVANNGPLCEGETLMLTTAGDPNYPGMLYAWNGPGFTSNLQNPSIPNATAANAGVYTMDAFDPQTLCVNSTLSTTVVVNALPVPVATNTGPYCVGATVMLMETTGGFAQWMWTGPNGFSSANQNPTIANSTTVNGGTYTVSVIDANGCESLPVSTEVIVNTVLSVTLTNNGPICDGANVTFVATPLVAAANYTFTSPLGVANGPFTSNVFTNAVFSGTDDGVWTVDVADVNNCPSNSAQTTLVITPTPIAIASNGGAPCIGGTIQLFAQTVTGATYAWLGPNGFTSSAQNPTRMNVTVADAGDYSLTVTVNGCASTQVTTTVTINALPVPTPTNAGPYCVGQTIMLMETTGGFSQWMWTGPNGFSSANQNPNIANATTTNAGTYNLTVIDANGCMSLPVSTEVIVNPVPSVALTSNAPVCAGATLLLTASAVPGATYTFTDPAGGVTGPQASNFLSVVAVAATHNGTWTVSVTSATCGAQTATAFVQVNAAPTAPTVSSNTPVCAGNTLTLTASTTALGATYMWAGPNGYSQNFIGTGANVLFNLTNTTAANAGDYSLTITQSGCTNFSTTNVVVNAVPTASFTLSRTLTCFSSVSPITATYTGTGGTTFTWNCDGCDAPAPLGVAQESFSYSTAFSAGQKFISLMVSDGNGCTATASTQAITVKNDPNITIASNSPLCVGETLMLTASGDPNYPGLLYTWLEPVSGFNSALQNPSILNVTAANAGTYSLFVFDPATDCTVPTLNTTVVVNALPLPVATNGGPYCTGNTINLMETTGGFAQWMWTGPNGFSSSNQNPNIANATTANAGTYTVSVMSVNGCESLPVSTEVIVSPTTPVTLTSNAPVCAGATLILTATAISGGTYTFTDPTGGVTGPQASNFLSVVAVAATHNGTWTVSVTSAACAPQTATAFVLVNAAPTAPTVSTNTPVCVANTLTLTATATVSGATYMWTGPNGYSQSFIGTGANVLFNLTNVTLANAGGYSLTITQNGCTNFSTTAVVINARPVATLANISPVCVGQNFQLLATPAGQANYTFTQPTLGALNNGNNPLLTLTSIINDNGTWSVVVTDANGCTSLPATTVVTVNAVPATPTPNSNSPICVGQTLQLFAPSVTGATYAWTGPSAFASAVQNPIRTSATAAMAGTYSLVVTVNGCASAQGTVAVVINAAPTAPTATATNAVCAGATLSLTALTTTAGATYQWAGPNGYSLTFTGNGGNITQSITNATAANAGFYTLTVNNNGCGSASSTLQVTVNPSPNVTVTNNSPLCTGSTLFLTATSLAGASYSFTPPVGAATVTASNTLSIAANSANHNGVWTITTTVSGCASTVTSLVTVNGPAGTPTVAVTPNTTVCEGATFAVSTPFVAGGTYQWFGPNGFTSTSPAPAAITNATAFNAGTYSVVLTQNGCASTAGTATVTVVTRPVISLVQSNTPICQGQTLNITVQPSGAGTYNFTSPSGAVTSQASNTLSVAAVQATHNGTWLITISNGGCVSTAATTNVVINAGPAAPTVSNNGPLCAGQNLQLNASSVSGATYNWTGPAGFVSGLQNPMRPAVTAAMGGLYSLVITVNGCASVQTTTSVTVNPNPVPTIFEIANDLFAPYTVCQGEDFVLQETTFAFASYQWTGPNGFVSTDPFILILAATPANSGLYSLTVTNGNGCTGSTSGMVDVRLTPTANFTVSDNVVCTGENVQTNYTGVNADPFGTLYSWNCDGCDQDPINAGINVASASPQNFTWSTSGVKTVSLQVINPTFSDATNTQCFSAIFSQVVTVSGTPVAPVVLSNSPVCSGGTITLTVQATQLGVAYQWTGPNGYSQSFTGTGANVVFNLTTNASPLQAGTYSLSIGQSGCAPAVTTDVIVNVGPTASFTLSRTTTCFSSVDPIVATFTGSATATTFTWNCDGCDAPGPLGVSQENFLYSTSFVPGQKFISLMVADGNGCTASAPVQTVTLKNDPNVTIANNGPLCVGETLMLTAAGDPNYPGLLFSWTEPVSGFNSALQNPSIPNVTAANAGDYRLFAFDPVSLCPVTPLTTTVTVNALPVPVATNGGPYCTGATINLMETTGGFSQWMWTGPMGFSSANQNPNIANATPANAGTYNLSVIDANGCESLPVSTEVIVNPTQPVTLTSNAPVCAGANLLLTATAISGATYTFTDPTGGVTGPQASNFLSVTAVPATHNGTWTVSVTSAVCQPQTATTFVFVNAAAVAPTVSSNTPVCAGSTLTLTTTASVNGASYMWTGPNGYSQAFIGTGANVLFDLTNVSASNAGGYSLTITQNGCTAFNATNVVINARPTITFSNSGPVCEGGALTLKVTPVGLANYTFTSPNGLVTNNGVNSQLIVSPVTASDNGMWTVIATNASGCASLPMTTNVVVNTTPAISAANGGTVCEGGTVTLTAPMIPGGLYNWTLAAGALPGIPSNQQNVTLTNVPAGNYTFNLTVTVNGCVSPMATTTVTVNNAPNQNFTFVDGLLVNITSQPFAVCEGQSLGFATSLGLTPPANRSFNWTGPNGFVSTAPFVNIPSATLANSGVYTLVLTNNNTGCTTTKTLSTLVNPAPTATFTATPGTACTGQSVTVLANGTADALATYFWNCNGCDQDPLDLGFIPATAGPHTFTWATAGVKAVTLDVTNSTGCPNATQGVQFINVNATPASPVPLTTSVTVCSGGTLMLTVSGGLAGVTYMWTGPAGFSQTITPVLPGNVTISIANATPANSGFYTVVATQNGCASAPTTIQATVAPAFIASFTSGSAVLCTGTGFTTFTYTGMVPMNGIYTWNFDAGAVPANAVAPAPTPQTVSWTTSGVKTITLTVTDVTSGCVSNMAMQAVTVLSAPTAPTATHNGPICAGGTLMLSASPSIPGATYSWAGPNNFASSQQNPMLINAGAAAAGVYSVTLTLNGCASTTAMTLPVLVNPATVPVANSNGPACVGGTLNLTANTIAGATYMWTGPNGFSSNQQNPTLPNVQSFNGGVYVLNVTAPGCGPASTSINVPVIDPVSLIFPISSNSPVCAGTTLNLTANNVAGATYSWTGPLGFSANTHNASLANIAATNAGVYSLTVNINGCMSMFTTTVAVQGRPARPTIGSNSPVCAGQTLQLTATNQANVTYHWTGPNSFVSTMQNPTIPNVTSFATGTYTLFVTSTVTGCASLTRTIAVTINGVGATATANNNSPICAGATLNLTAPTIIGATYSWTGPNGFSSVLQNPSITNTTAANAGVYSLIITSGTCASLVVATTAVINGASAPTTAGSITVCEAGTLSLTASTISGATYMWTGPNGFTSALQNPTINPVGLSNGGVYSVVATVNGCASAAATTSVTVNARPAAPTTGNNGPLCVGSTINLTAASVSGASYQWTGPNGFNSTLQNPTIANSTTANGGAYTLVMTVSGCASLPTTSTVNFQAGGALSISVGNNGPVCTGATLNLTASTVLGASYSWTGPNAFSSNQQNPSINNVTTANAGTYSVVVTLGGCSATATTSASVTGALAATATNNGPVCPGQTLQLTANTVSGATYQWTGPNGFASNQQNPTISGVSTANGGIYTLTISVSGCGTSTTITSVAISAFAATPSVGNNGPLCIGQTLQLTTTFVSGATYSWTGPNGFSSNQQNPTRVIAGPADGGTYSLITTVNGCVSAVGTTFVSVSSSLATPSVGNNGPLCVGQTLQLTASFVSGATYSWTGPNGFSSNLQNPTRVIAGPADGGTYSLVVAVNGCVSSVATTFVTVNSSISSPAVGNNGPICAGQTLQLLASFVSGATYSWTGPNGFSSNQQNPIVLNAAVSNGGTYSVIIAVGGCVSSPSITTVTVNAAPTLTLQSVTNAGCGGTGTIRVTASGSSPLYSINGTGFSNTTGIFSGLAAGTYTLQATSGGCTSNTISVTISGQATSTITSVTANVGNPTSALDVSWTSVSGAQSYNLRYRVAGSTGAFTSINSLTTTTTTVNGLLAGTSYEFQVQTICSGGASSAFSASVSGATTTASGSGTCGIPLNLAMTVTGPNTGTVTWSPTGSAVCYIVSYGPLSSNPNIWPQFLVPHPGSSLAATGLLPGQQYGLRIRTNCSLCSTNSGIRSNWSSTVVFNTPSSKEGAVETLTDATPFFTVYPNPNKGAFSVTFDGVQAGDATLEVFDVTGRAVYTKTTRAEAGRNEIGIDLTHQAAGVYHLRFTTGGVTRSVKVVVN